MKKHIFVILLTALLLLCACQPTPEEPIVMQKDQETMVDKAKDEISQEERNLSLKERLNVPDRYQYEYQKGYVTVEADAEVLVPDGELPIIRVFPDNFDQATANRLWNALVGDIPMYEYDAAMTKDAIKLQMDYLVRIINGDIPQEDAMESVEEAQEELLALQTLFANAPDDVPRVIADATLKTAYVGTKRNPRMAQHTYVSGTSLETGAYFQLVNNLNNKEPIILREDDSESIKPVLRGAYMNYGNKNAPEGCCDRIIGKYRAGDALPDEIARSFPVTPEQAFSEAQRFLQSAGLNDRFSIGDILLIDGRIGDTTVYAYSVSCVRSVRDIPCLPAVGVLDASDSGDVYKPIWKYEQLILVIGRNGLSSVAWSSPYAESDVITEQTKLLPFSDIQAIAEKMLPIVMTAQADGEATDQTCFSYRIDRVQLGLWRICEFEDIEKGLLIPAWGFFALTEETSRFGETVVRYSPILLINAIDGSIIDPVKGY